tara:strand:- start:182 stop:919 length:738 start_codon:yes stop_codon:yes gene_type:complete
MIRELIDDLMLKVGETKRMDCPECGGKNTFTVTKNSGSVLWNCYKASCNIRGATGAVLSRDEFARRMEPEKPVDKFEIPESFSMNFSDQMVKYLANNNVFDAWKNNRVDLYHDVTQNRAVFIIKSSGQAIDAVGRALGRGVKWHRYGKSKKPFVVKTDVNHAFVVEDAASAAAVSEFGTGIALLGTHLTDEALEVIAEFRSVTVALDRDAMNKALHLTRRLKQFTTATMKILKEDPKLYPRGVIE